MKLNHEDFLQFVLSPDDIYLFLYYNRLPKNPNVLKKKNKCFQKHEQTWENTSSKLKACKFENSKVMQNKISSFEGINGLSNGYLVFGGSARSVVYPQISR